MKTLWPLLCSPLIPGELKRRFVERANRVKWALLLECLDHFVDEARIDTSDLKILQIFAGPIR
jgi:hypothetical protein